MRKLGLKLGLSCAALAACATTLVSTTFAWYTSNDSVKATGITGKTSEQDGTLLLISKLGTKGSWGASVDLSKETAGVVLDPLAYVDGAYYGWNPDANAVASTPAEANKTAGSYISFTLYFKSGSGADLPVNVEEVTLTNTTKTLPTKSVLAAGTGSTDATYSIDMFRATNIATTVYNTKEVEKDAPAVAESTTRTCYYLDSYASADDSFEEGTSNAHEYYNNVKSLKENTTEETSDDPIDTKKTSSESGQKDFKTDFAKTGTTIGNTGVGGDASGLDNCLAVRFDIYLDGWDVACFDACRQQTFTLQMSFTSKTE